MHSCPSCTWHFPAPIPLASCTPYHPQVLSLMSGYYTSLERVHLAVPYPHLACLLTPPPHPPPHPQVLSLMSDYCISREQVDAVLDMTKFKTQAPWGADPMKDVATKVKSAFTRQDERQQGWQAGRGKNRSLLLVWSTMLGFAWPFLMLCQTSLALLHS